MEFKVIIKAHNIDELKHNLAGDRYYKILGFIYESAVCCRASHYTDEKGSLIRDSKLMLDRLILEIQEECKGLFDE